ncbi:hypothetical protein [Halosimplex salinum]|uniref:hypothetical protein n=1 Tax=Halosimplex salinum TaxID=1710538 RepID=UPI000F48E1E7|nr:hypothetical protein [Halosimplex salinum]
MRTRSLCLVLLVLCSVTAPSVAGGTTSEKPSVDITVGSTAVSEGDVYEAGGDVALTINASVGDDAPDGTQLSEIVVRVNGERDRSISVDGASVSETLTPELSNGNNSVRVIVTDDAGSVDATSFTVAKDVEAPYVYLTSPYKTAPWKQITDGTANETGITLAGNVIEDSTVEKLHITREFDGERSTRVLRDVGENFSVEMELGYGENGSATNEFRVSVTDEFDNVRLYRFSVNVTDDRAPRISVEPFPNETTSNRIFLAGAVSDEVGIRSANLTVRGPDGNVTGGERIAGSSSELDPDRRTASFNESLYTLYPGTYEATLAVVDVTGKQTTRTVEIERVPNEERDVAPEIAVDRDRTVVIGPERLFLSGVAFEGVTERLVVETRRESTGETLDYQVVHSGSRSERVEFDREVAIAAERTRVIVRATDAKGIEHTERFVVDGETQETFVGEAGDGESRWPRVSVEHLRDDRAGTASASVSVLRGGANATVSLPGADGPSAVVATENVSVDSLAIDLAAETNVTATVVARERAGDALDAPDGATPAATVTIQHSVADDAVDGAAFDVSVRRAYLDANGLDPSNLSVYRQSGGNWSAVDTTLAESNETHVRYTADSPGLSVFSLSTDPVLADDGNGTVENGTAGNGTVGNATVGNATVENGTAPNGTAGNETAGDGGEPTIFVENVTVNLTAVAVNESVAVNVTLANDGDAEGTYTAGLQTIHGMNVSFVGKESVAVGPGEQREIGFTTQFATEGNHTVMVNGTQAGPVVVGSGGGLFSFLSFLSFLPLRLIGMALGGILGLLLVLVLLRFVLGKVGGGGESTSG